MVRLNRGKLPKSPVSTDVENVEAAEIAQFARQTSDPVVPQRQHAHSLTVADLLTGIHR